jgi:murein DD-endopeptidase MepM/ murein hydrolase activator NlpD
MARIKYYYNTETCNYERIKISKWDIVFDGLGYLTMSLVLAVGITIFYHKYFDSPKEATLRQANETLKLHYEILQQEINKGNEILSTLQERDNSLYRTLLEADPIPSTVRTAGVGGIDYYQSLPKDTLIAEVAQKLEQLKRKLQIQTKSYDDLNRLAKNKENLLACIPAIQPISNRELKRLASGFGIRLHPVYKVMKMHEGLDFAAPRGTPIYATGDGIVKVVKKSVTGYGNEVVINHGYGFLTRYAHLQAFKVTVGQKVKRGQCIGYVGSTGCTSGPHLHYEVIKNGKKVNPAYYLLSGLTPKEYDTLIRLASVQNKSLD